ncbi:MAG: DUF1552 domain-containing protein [Polyangiales bacterium]
MAKIHRRAVLRGLAGASVALPWLECMMPARGRAQVAPARYAILFAGQALGGDGYAKNASRVDGQNVNESGHFIADTTYGRGFALTTPLLPLAGMENEFSMVSNLAIPFNTNSTDGSAVPSGGAYRDFHGGGASPLLSGTRSTSPSYICNGITSDQVIANLNAGQTTHESLVYRSQPGFYVSGYGFAGRQYISYGSGGGSGGRVEAQASPEVAYRSLFQGFVPDDDDEAARFDFALRGRRSVLDLVLEKRAKLMNNVGRADEQRLERHFDEIRDLENRLGALPPVVSGTCFVPPDPGPDPAIGGDHEGGGTGSVTSGTGYSDEHARSRLFADLIHMAFVCDLSRAASLQITAFQSHMNARPIADGLGTLPGTTRPARWASVGGDLHEVGHNGDPDNRGQIPSAGLLGWHVSHYAYLIDKLRTTPEGDGNALDNTVLVFTAEAGHGLQLNDGTSQNQTHSVENMVMLVAGRAGGLNPGEHIDGGRQHPARVLVRAMQAAGYQGNALGDVTGTIDL